MGLFDVTRWRQLVRVPLEKITAWKYENKNDDKNGGDDDDNRKESTHQSIHHEICSNSFLLRSCIVALCQDDPGLVNVSR